MTRYKNLFYLINTIRIKQEVDLRYYITSMTFNQFATEQYIDDYNYKDNEDLILQLK